MSSSASNLISAPQSEHCSKTAAHAAAAQHSSPKILVLGSLNVDYVYEVPHFLQPGETLSSTSRHVYAGGKGLNQAVSLSKAGGDVSFSGAIGTVDGAILLETLESNNINSQNVKQLTDVPSGHTFIQVDAHGQNCILLYGGANQTITSNDIDAALKSFSAGDCLVIQNETNALDEIIDKASAKGLYVCMNTSPVDEKLTKLPLHKCSLLIVNEIEGAALSSLSADTAPKLMLQRLAEIYKDSSILLTLGSSGSLFLERGKQEPIACSAFKVEPVDTTAAGDTFLGYFITMLSKGHEPSMAMTYASAAAALAVTRHGAAPSIPYVHEVEEYLKAQGYSL